MSTSSAVLHEVFLFAGIADIVVNGVGDGAVAVYFLEGDLPFVVAFFAVHRHHGIQGGAVSEAQLCGVFDGFLQVLVAIDQEIAPTC
jgi:hypothetical protein